MRAIRAKYADDHEDNQIDWYCHLGESGASTSRREYQRLREHIAEYDVVVAHELDRLGRSFADLAGFVEDLRKKEIDIDLVNHPIGTVGEDDWMVEMMVFADAERETIRSHVQEGIDATSDEADTIAWMYHNGKRFHVTEEETSDGTPTRKQVYLPKHSNSDDEDENEGLSEAWIEMCGEWEFEDVDGEPSEGLSFSRLLADIRCEEEVEQRKQKVQDGEVDTGGTVVFETNHPYVTAGDADDQQIDERAFIHMIERLIRWYRHRWGIENGFKKQKHCIVRTTSAERDYRFFNFAFACVLYNVWRLVDLLVKLALDGEYTSYSPRVDANQFLTVAKQCYSLDPPD